MDIKYLPPDCRLENTLMADFVIFQVRLVPSWGLLTLVVILKEGHKSIHKGHMSVEYQET